MKILWFTWKDRMHPLAGGAELVNEELARRLVSDGHEVTLVVGGFAGGPNESIVDGYRIVRLGNRYALYPLAYWYYRRHLQGWADVVIDEVNTLPFFARWYVREPVVLFVHQLCREIWFHQMIPPLSWIGYVLEPWYLHVLRGVPVITVSDSTRQDLLRCGFELGGISIISEGIELEPLQTLGGIEKYAEPTMLSLGALRSMKRTDHQLRAFELAKRSIPNLKLIIAGSPEGAYGKRVVDAIAQSPYAQDIEYRGRVSKQQKLELLQRAHVLAVTSTKEGWGLVVTEAASQGTPAVVYDVDGLRDSVQHGKTGIVVATSPQALAEGIVTLLRDATIYQALRHAAWQWSKRLTFEQSYQDFSKLIAAPKLWQPEYPHDERQYREGVS